MFFFCSLITLVPLPPNFSKCVSLPLNSGHDWPFATLWNNGHGLVGHFYTNNIIIQNNVQEKNDHRHGQKRERERERE